MPLLQAAAVPLFLYDAKASADFPADARFNTLMLLNGTTFSLLA